MLQRDKENLELRLQRLKEDAKEDFFEAQQIFLEEYEEVLASVFWEKKPELLSLLRAYFEIHYVDAKLQNWGIHHKKILENALRNICGDLPLSSEKKKILLQSLQTLIQFKKPKSELYHYSQQLQHHPYFPLIEDMALDWDLSREEFYALEFAFSDSSWDFTKTLDLLPPELSKRLKLMIDRYINIDRQESERSFREEYAPEITHLQEKWIETSQVIVFVARSYYKNPGRYKKYEHPKRRLKRTFKLALLRLLRKKLGMIDAENIAKRFEEWDSFIDAFMLLYELLEILPENPQSHEVYQASDALENAEDILTQSENIEEKILKWQKVTTEITRLIWDVESEMDGDILERFLDESTDLIWQEIYFRDESESAWILSEWKKSQESDDNEDEQDDKKYEKLSPRWAFEAIKEDFFELEKEKTKAFLDGRYDDIDIYNERLFVMQKKLEKLAVLLWEEL